MKTVTIKVGKDGRAFVPGALVLEAARLSHSGSADEFRQGSLSALRIDVWHRRGFFSTYHTFRGGEEFRPVLPRSRLCPGETATVAFRPLTIISFLSELPNLEFSNPEAMKWVSGMTRVELLASEPGTIEVLLSQERRFQGTKDLAMRGRIEGYPGKSNQFGGVYLQFAIEDYANRRYRFRVRHDGQSLPSLQINRGSGFETIHHLAFDRYRLAIWYGGVSTLTTIYVKPPLEAFSLRSAKPYRGSYLDFVGHSTAWTIEVKMNDYLDKARFALGSTYDQGRLGSEIAYTIGVKHLKLNNLVMEEPSKGGRDLHTRDGRAAIQARLLRDFPVGGFEKRIKDSILNLVAKVIQDYRYNWGMSRGYAVLSFRDQVGVVRAVVIGVDKPAEGSAPSTPRLRGACSTG